MTRLLLCSVCCALVALPAGGQTPRRAEPSPADRFIARGQLDDAESLLYEASSASPRDPVARAALGTFLASRGHLKVGAVLLEEARQFGGDARTINARLGHVYQWLGTWGAAGSPTSGPFWSRAAYLAKNPGALTGPDSTVVRLEPNELAGVGRISLDIGGVIVEADIDPRVEGLVLPAALDTKGGVEPFGTADGARIGVANTVTIGAYVLRNVPVRVEPVSTARVGLDVLAPMEPMFDIARKTLALRATPVVPANGREMPATRVTPLIGRELRMLLTFPGVSVVTRAGQAPVALESAAGRAAVRGSAWTFDLKRGAVIVR